MSKSKKKRKIDITWTKLNDKHHILDAIKDKGYFIISAKQIGEFQEARLAVKFDHSDARPDLFEENNLSILPITRGDYYISHINAYHNFESDTSEITYLRPPEHIKSLDVTSINSESKALNMAYISGIFRTWHQKMAGKPVRPVFLIYSNSIFYLYEYRFKELQHYNSLELVKHKRYCLEDTHISVEDVQKVLRKIRFNKEPNIQFPQANSFERVINICELLYINDVEKNFITEEYSFDVRQSSYYLDAARYLGLVEKLLDSDGHDYYTLTKLGKSLFSMSYKQRQLKLIETILSYKSFNLTYKAYCKSNKRLSDREIAEFIKKAGVINPRTGAQYSDATYKRRSSTVRSWIRWIKGIMED